MQAFFYQPFEISHCTVMINWLNLLSTSISGQYLLLEIKIFNDLNTHTHTHTHTHTINTNSKLSQISPFNIERILSSLFSLSLSPSWRERMSDQTHKQLPPLHKIIALLSRGLSFDLPHMWLYHVHPGSWRSIIIHQVLEQRAHCTILLP